MTRTRQYSAAEMERMMKLQDVLLKAMARRITWWAAAEIIGVTDRTMRRKRGAHRRRPQHAEAHSGDYRPLSAARLGQALGALRD